MTSYTEDLEKQVENLQEELERYKCSPLPNRDQCQLCGSPLHLCLLVVKAVDPNHTDEYGATQMREKILYTCSGCGMVYGFNPKSEKSD
jgi:uncharacterized protein with PIN domain